MRWKLELNASTKLFENIEHRTRYTTKLQTVLHLLLAQP